MATDKLIVRIQMETDKANREVDKLTKQINKLKKTTDGKWSSDTTKSFNGVSKSAKSLTGTLKTLAATFVTFQAGKSLITTAADIEEGFLGVQKTTGLTGEAMKELEDEILELSTTMAGVSVGELQTIAETAGQLGIEGKDNILSFTETIAMVGVTTDLTADQAAEGFAKISNAMGLPIEATSNLAAAMNELSNTSAVTVSELTNVTQRMAPMAKTFGLSTEEVLAFATTLKSLGTNTEVAGSSMSRLMGQMLGDVQGFAKASGTSVEEFSELLRTEPVEALKLFLTKLGELDKFEKVAVLDNLKISSVETRGAVIKLSDGMDILNKSLKTSNTAWEENTSHLKEYEVASEGFNAQMTKVENTLKVLAAKIGEALLPKLKELAEEFAVWVNSIDDAKIAEFSEDIAGLVDVLASVTTAISGFITAIGSFVTDYPTLSKTLLGLITALKTIQFLLPGVGTAFMKMGKSTVALGVASSKLSTGIGVLRGSLVSTIAMSNPWGVAMVAMGAAAAYAFNEYIESAEAAIEVNKEVSKSYDDSATGTDSITQSLVKLSTQMETNGRVSSKLRDDTLKGIKAEIAATNKRIQKMEQSKTKTVEQTRAIQNQRDKVSSLKALIDTFDARYTVDMDVETKEATASAEKLKGDIEKQEIEAQMKLDDKRIKSQWNNFQKSLESKTVTTKIDADTRAAETKYRGVKRKVETPLKTPVDYDPNTSATDSARRAISKPIRVPVIYVPQNSPGGVSGSSGATVRGATTSSTALTGSAAPIVNFTTPTQSQSVQVNLEIDGNKLKTIMEKNTVKNFESYLLREGGI